MGRVKFIVDCLPYAGVPDRARQQEVARFIAAEVGAAAQDVSFSELGIGDVAGVSELVQPGLIIHASVDPHNVEAHREMVVKITLAAQAISLYVVRVSVQLLTSYAAHLLATGALSGTAIGRAFGADGVDGSSDARAAGMFLGAVLGALIGGAVGSAIKKDGPVLGIWQRDDKGIWRWTPAELLVPVRRQPA
jgi:hypothetical protein